MRPVIDSAAADGEVVSVDGVRLFVRRFGDAALPMLIVVHGGPTWDHTYLLSPVSDLPDAALQPDLLANDVAALIRHYDAARADVLGFSYGGGIAMRMIDQHPDL